MKDSVAIISGAPLGLAPYLHFYLNILKENEIDYIILNVEANQNGKRLENQILFDHEYKPGFFNRVVRLTKGLLYLHKNIKTHNCKKIIAAPTRTGIRLLPYLIIFFRNRYILDIRDFTNEDKKIFKFLEDFLIDNSYLTLISSKGFLSFIKKSDKVMNVHNIPFKFSREEFPMAIDKSKIVIGSVGMISYYNENNALIQKLANNQCIDLQFHGIVTEEWKIEEYLIKNNHIKNMKFFGKFDNSKKAEIYKQISIINNIYGNDSINTRTLTANRLYDAAIYKKPVIVSCDTYLAEVVKAYGLGIIVDVFNDDIYKVIMDYVESLNLEEFNQCCDVFLEHVLNEQNKTVRKIIEFCEVNKN